MTAYVASQTRSYEFHDTGGTNHAYVLQTGDSLEVLPGVTLTGSSQVAIFGGYPGAVVVNRGALISSYARVGSLDAGGSLTNLGSIRGVGDTWNGDISVVFFGYGSSTRSRLVNSGLIESDYFWRPAVLAWYATVEVENSGTIRSPGRAFDGRFLIHNSGLIDAGPLAGTYAISLTNEATGVVRGLVTLMGGALDNRGLIDGAVKLSLAATSFVNAGHITGGVQLSGEDDVFDGSAGRIDGPMQGGFGQDRVVGTDGGDVIYGDRADAVYDPQQTYYRVSDIISGGFGDDMLYGQPGDDVLYGNQDADWLHGGLGNDRLYGGRDADTLNGGKGDDLLQGGLGEDLFVFDASFGRDVVTDWDWGGASDRIRFRAGTFTSYAEVASHMLQDGADVLITLDATNGVRLLGVSVAALTAERFSFG